jgi:hypothetical protein
MWRSSCPDERCPLVYLTGTTIIVVTTRGVEEGI